MLLSKRNQACAIIFLITLLLVLVLPAPALSKATRTANSWVAKPDCIINSYLGQSLNDIALADITSSIMTPILIRNAYNLPSTGGSGTIAIIDPFNDSTVQNDLATFSNQFSLSTPNLEIHPMATRIANDSSWAMEVSLDVEWAHAIAPNAKILLVEAKSDLNTDLLSAVSYAAGRSDVVAVSMSWGGPESPGEISFDSFFTSNHGVVFFASSGDNGAGVSFPSSSPNVVAVGGTTLKFNIDGTVASETGWVGSGGGISSFETEPQYQVTYNVTQANGKRTVPDVSYDADPSTGFYVYDSTPINGKSGWWQVGGTSAGAPQWAAIQSLGLSVSNSNLYQDAKRSLSTYFRDIISGSNGAYSAGVGYDLVTGLGSPVTWNFTAKTPAITGFNLVNSGSGYTTPAVILIGGGGTGATATARVSQGRVIGVVLTNAGTAYTSAPTVTFRDPSPRAKGAVANAIFQ
jgi:subtilase family serine protease